MTPGHDNFSQQSVFRANPHARKPPPNYFQRREQVRLLILCAMLMFVLVMMDEARKPSNWDWLWSDNTNATHLVADSAETLGTRLDDSAVTLPIDGFRAEAEPEPLETSLPNAFAEVTPELLRPIKDNTVMRAAENDAWLTLLSILQSHSAEDIGARSTGDVGFAQLFRQTDFYRGRLVTVRGIARRVESIQPRENNRGITQLYRWVLRPDGSNSPMIIYSLEKPTEIPLADDLRETCEFTCFCFKRWAYAAADGTRVAPLLLAKTPRWTPATPTAETPLPTRPELLKIILSVIGVSIGIAVFVHVSASRKRAEIERLRKLSSNLDQDLAGQTVFPNTWDVLGELQDTAVDEAHEPTGES